MPSRVALSATEVALKAADKPILGIQACPRAPSNVRWNDLGTISDTDETTPGYPNSRAYDGLNHLSTYPTGVKNTYYLVFDFGAPITFDFVALVGQHGLHVYNATGTITIQVDANDDGAFTGTQDICVLGTLAQDKRYAEFTLDHTGSTPYRYTAQYVRVKLDDSTTPHKPALSEFIFGRRYQLKHPPNIEYDPNNLESDAETVVTAGGVRQRISFSEGRRILRANLNPHETSYINDLIAWFAGSSYGTRPFVWVEKPNTDDQAFNMMLLDDPSFSFPGVGWTERKIDIAASEQGPERFYLVQE